MLAFAGCGPAVAPIYTIPGEAQRKADQRFSEAQERAAEWERRQCEDSPPYNCPVP
jgi:hypothetical protein